MGELEGQLVAIKCMDKAYIKRKNMLAYIKSERQVLK
jgi:hypothetical protein